MTGCDIARMFVPSFGGGGMRHDSIFRWSIPLSIQGHGVDLFLKALQFCFPSLVDGGFIPSIVRPTIPSSRFKVIFSGRHRQKPVERRRFPMLIIRHAELRLYSG